MPEIRVVIADDQQLLRQSLVHLLDHQPGIRVVAEAATGVEAVSVTRELAPDVVLMDIRMPVMDGTEATRQITELGGDTKVLVLTTFDLDEYVFAALRNGASGFLLKDALPDDLLGAIRTVARGGAVVAPTATRRLLDHVAPKLPVGKPRDDSRLTGLTDREREVLMEVARGANNAEIGSRLYMAEGTVKTHIGRLLAKLQARDRVGLVLIAHECGLLD